jgi:hypothetical protein
MLTADGGELRDLLRFVTAVAAIRDREINPLLENLRILKWKSEIESFVNLTGNFEDFRLTCGRKRRLRSVSRVYSFAGHKMMAF